MLLRADTRVDLIKGLPLFELCSKRDLRRIAALGDERSVPRGTELISEGEPGSEFFVVFMARERSAREAHARGLVAVGSCARELRGRELAAGEQRSGVRHDRP